MAKRFFLIRARLAYQTLRDEWGPGGPSPVFEQPRFGVTPLPDSIRGGIEWRENPGFLARRRWTPPIRVELTLGYQGMASFVCLHIMLRHSCVLFHRRFY
jgi:hypothetical protein